MVAVLLTVRLLVFLEMHCNSFVEFSLEPRREGSVQFDESEDDLGPDLPLSGAHLQRLWHPSFVRR